MDEEQRLKAVLATPAGIKAVVEGLFLSQRQDRSSPWAHGETAESLAARRLASLEPWEKVMERTKDKVLRHLFVDVVSIDSKSEDFLRFKAKPETSFQSSTDGRMVAVKGTKPPDVSQIFTPARVWDGFEKLVEIYAEVAPSRVLDLVAFGRKLKTWPNSTPEGQAMFLKHFLKEKASSDTLASDMDGASFLHCKFLMGGSVAQPRGTARAASQGKAAHKRSASSAGLSQSSSSAAGGRRGGSGGGRASGASKSDRPCKSRVVKGWTCNYDPCCFSHDCVSCGGDHAASFCGAWDEDKAKAAAEAMRRRP